MAASAFAIDRQVIGHHLVDQVGLGNALQRDAVAYGVAAVEQDRIALRAVDAGLLRARDLEISGVHTRTNAGKTCAARLGSKNQRAAIGADRHLTAGQRVQQVAQFERHIGQGLVVAGAGISVFQVRRHDAVKHRAVALHLQGDEVPNPDLARKGEDRHIAHALGVERHQHIATHQCHIGVTVACRTGGDPGLASIGGAHDAAVADACHNRAAVLRHGDRCIGQVGGRTRMRPGLAAIGRQVNAGRGGACRPGGQRHLQGVRHGHIAPVHRALEGGGQHLTLARKHQRKVHAGEREAHGIKAWQIACIDLAIAIGIDQRATMQTGKGLQIAAPHGHHIVADAAPVFEHQVAGGLLKAQVAAHVEEIADRDVHRTGGPDQGPLVAVHMQAAARLGSCQHVHRFGGKVRHQLTGILRTAQAKHLVDFHQQVLGLNGQGVAAYEGHLIGRNLQTHPAQAAQIQGVLFERLEGVAVRALQLHVLGAEQGQRELGIGQDKTACRSIGRVGAVDDAIAVAVHLVGTAHAHKGVEPGAAHGQAVHQHLGAIGQRHGGG